MTKRESGERQQARNAIDSARAIGQPVAGSSQTQREEGRAPRQGTTGGWARELALLLPDKERPDSFAVASEDEKKNTNREAISGQKFSLNAGVVRVSSSTYSTHCAISSFHCSLRCAMCILLFHAEQGSPALQWWPPFERVRSLLCAVSHGCTPRVMPRVPLCAAPSPAPRCVDSVGCIDEARLATPSASWLADRRSFDRTGRRPPPAQPRPAHLSIHTRTPTPSAATGFLAEATTGARSLECLLLSNMFEQIEQRSNQRGKLKGAARSCAGRRLAFAGPPAA